MRYDGPPPAHALAGIDLDIGAGERVAVTGPSGSGKSTLLNTIGLLEHPTAGTRILAGHDTAALNDRRTARLRAATVGFVFQTFHLLPERTATENVTLGLAIGRIPPHRRRARARQLLDDVGLSHRADAPTRHLSGGERQRVAIARALACDPPLLLCDEPTGNLDSHATDAVLAILADQHARGVTVVVVTHESDVAAWAHRRIHVRDGLIVDA
ncbi:MAG: ABC transporter ATP-binding protein [Mobilicoccus sp.]|nr:ABC transporter ATP-binding protein [Mobilicoccus sp.]